MAKVVLIIMVVVFLEIMKKSAKKKEDDRKRTTPQGQGEAFPTIDTFPPREAELEQIPPMSTPQSPDSEVLHEEESEQYGTITTEKEIEKQLNTMPGSHHELPSSEIQMPDSNALHEQEREQYAHRKPLEVIENDSKPLVSFSTAEDVRNAVIYSTIMEPAWKK